MNDLLAQIKAKFNKEVEEDPNIVTDADGGEIRLAGDRTQRGKFRCRKPRDVICPGLRVGHPFQHRLVRRGGQRDMGAELWRAGFIVSHYGLLS